MSLLISNKDVMRRLTTNKRVTEFLAEKIKHSEHEININTRETQADGLTTDIYIRSGNKTQITNLKSRDGKTTETTYIEE